MVASPLQSDILEQDEFGQEIPKPGEMFSNRVIDPRNLMLEQRFRSGKPLPMREYKRYSRRYKDLVRHMTSVGMIDAKTDFMMIRKQFDVLRDERQKVKRDSPEFEKISSKIAQLVRQSEAIRKQMMPFRAGLIELYQVERLLQAHMAAVLREEEHRRMEDEMQREAETFREIIEKTWTQLGYRQEIPVKKGRKVVRGPRLEKMQVGPDAVWFRIKVSEKRLVGWDPKLPLGVSVNDLIQDTVLLTLSNACQRQVTAHPTKTNGTWIKVNRLGSPDGLPKTVPFNMVMLHYPELDRSGLPFCIGASEGRNLEWVMFSKFPHLLVGGSTGTGKSVFLNNLACTLIRNNSPLEVQFVFIDLKDGLEFARYANLPHTLEMVKDKQAAASTVKRLEALREDRSLQLAKAGVRDIDGYNALAVGKGWKQMPRIICIFDEYAAIKSIGKLDKDIEDEINATVLQLINKARAVGIHMVLCTQVPSVEVIDGLIKGNINFRIAFGMPTGTSSVTILGVHDAAQIPADAPGRAVAMLGVKKWFIQTPLIHDAEIVESIRQGEAWRDELMALDIEKPTLPDLDGQTASFTREDLIDVALTVLNGNLGAYPIFDAIKEHGLASQRDVKRMVKTFRVGDIVTHNGASYVVRKAGTGLVLVALDVDETEKVAV